MKQKLKIGSHKIKYIYLMKPTERVKKTIKGIVNIVKIAREREREREQDDSPPQNSPKHKNSLLVKGKKYRDKKKEIDELQAEINDLENDLNISDKLLGKKNQIIAHLTNQGDRKQEQIILLAQQLTANQEKNRDLAKRINHLGKKLAKVQQREKKLTNTKKQYIQIINNLTAKLDQVRQTLDQENQELRDKLQKLQRRQDSGY